MATKEGPVLYFPDLEAWRRWLEKHHHKQSEQWVGFHKKATQKPSITWKESVDGALCFGWIDGLRKSIDAERYKIRFTPRKPTSIWSKVNLERVAELTALGLMHPAGLAAFEARKPGKSGLYSFEQETEPELSPAQQKLLRASKPAARYFEAAAPSYRRAAIWWVVSAKQAATRERRLAQLIKDSAEGRRLAHLTPTKRKR